MLARLGVCRTLHRAFRLSKVRRNLEGGRRRNYLVTPFEQLQLQKLLFEQNCLSSNSNSWLLLFLFQMYL